MENTGERLLTDDVYETTIEHLHRYAFALQFVSYKKVVDIASGEGYGSNLLAELAESVTGIDIAKESVEHASIKYKKDNLKYIIGSADNIPVEDNTVDVVVSFETIEHHDKHHEMLKEIKRILKDDGILIISSPDKYYYSDLRKTQNPYHIKELYFQEFKDLISLYFPNQSYYSQKLDYTSLILEENECSDFYEFSGNFEKITRNSQISNSVFHLAVASQFPVEKHFNSIFSAAKVLENNIDQFKKREKEFHDYYKSIIEEYQKSRNYKLGKTILAPIRLIKEILKK